MARQSIFPVVIEIADFISFNRNIMDPSDINWLNHVSDLVSSKTASQEQASAALAQVRARTLAESQG
ncbi:hypothetical protein R5H32_02685 [Defluviimonas sp. D31]|uniref:hypothetical protein n=1 Tax=Defluviimonas sp. D31 TaxID=3083253 RepID=UPI00296E9872|nr:hypothetical protein [Defluviimonas sp. D31]MDW4548254.1 hypothetical protein [Defluviimonas sp. D31]